MAKKISSGLYNLTRMFGKAASTVNDVETLATGDPQKIMKRIYRKVLGRTGHGLLGKLMRKL